VGDGIGDVALGQASLLLASLLWGAGDGRCWLLGFFFAAGKQVADFPSFLCVFSLLNLCKIDWLFNVFLRLMWFRLRGLTAVVFR
jgi:hypothetical protein